MIERSGTVKKISDGYWIRQVLFKDEVFLMLHDVIKNYVLWS